MWTKIKLYAGLAVGALIGALWFILGIVKDQRNEARRKAESAKRSHKATQTKAHKDASISKASANARQEAEQARRERNETPKAERRTGNSSSLDRLRD